MAFALPVDILSEIKNTDVKYAKKAVAMVEKQCSYKIDDDEGVTVRLIYRSGNLTVMVSCFVLDWGSGNRLAPVTVSEEKSGFEIKDYDSFKMLENAVYEFISQAGKISVSEAESCVRRSLEELKPQIRQYAYKN